MEPELTRIDRREEVPANERVQEQRDDRKGKKHRDQHPRVCQPPVERPLIGVGEPVKACLERVGDPAEQ